MLLSMKLLITFCFDDMWVCMIHCNFIDIVTNLGGNMARFTQFPLMITRSTIIYEIISPGAAGSSIYV